MNRILYVARKAKGYSVNQLSKMLNIDETEYTELEHSLNTVTARQALQLAKLFDIEPEMFLYNDSGDKQLIKFAMDEVSKIVGDVQAEQYPPRFYFKLVTLGNTALSLQAELCQSLYRQFELQKDIDALRQLNTTLKEGISTEGQ